MVQTKYKANRSRRVLRLAYLDHSKLAVLNTLTSPESRRVYEFAIEQFITWYLLRTALGVQSHCCRSLSDSIGGTWSRSGYDKPKACRRSSPAHEAADSGLLSPEVLQMDGHTSSQNV